ncbi:MAG: HNH endonuclease [Caldilineaceae bacterium]
METGSIVYWNERQGIGRDQQIPVKCGICGKIRTIAAYKIPNANFTGYCVDCARTGDRSVLWKGGRFTHQNGYIQVRLTPDHKFFSMADSHHLVREHRLVMAEHIGRCLRDDEIVHHKNGIKDDNRIENLELLDRHLHHTGYNAPKQNSLEEELLAMIKNLLNTIIGRHRRRQ